MMVRVALNPGKRFLIRFAYGVFVFLLGSESRLQCMLELFRRKCITRFFCQSRDGVEQGVSCIVRACDFLWLGQWQQRAYHVLCKIERQACAVLQSGRVSRGDRAVHAALVTGRENMRGARLAELLQAAMRELRGVANAFRGNGFGACAVHVEMTLCLFAGKEYGETQVAEKCVPKRRELVGEQRIHDADTHAGALSFALAIGNAFQKRPLRSYSIRRAALAALLPGCVQLQRFAAAVPANVVAGGSVAGCGAGCNVGCGGILGMGVLLLRNGHHGKRAAVRAAFAGARCALGREIGKLLPRKKRASRIFALRLRSFACDKRGTQGAHKIRTVWTYDALARKQLERAQHGIVHERSALHHNGVAQGIKIVQADDAKQCIFHHGIRAAGSKTVCVRAHFLRML